MSALTRIVPIAKIDVERVERGIAASDATARRAYSTRISANSSNVGSCALPRRPPIPMPIGEERARERVRRKLDSSPPALPALLRMLSGDIGEGGGDGSFAEGV